MLSVPHSVWPAVAVLAAAVGASTEDRPTASVDDAIAMVRIQPHTSIDGRIGAISPDGTKLAVVIWRGDTARNVNVYSLGLLDIRRSAGPIERPLRYLYSVDFTGEQADQLATPIADVMFTADGRKLGFLGRRGDRPAQLFTIDVETGHLAELTAHPAHVRSYVLSPTGELRMYSAVAINPAEAQRLARLDGEGGFVWDTDLFPSWRRHFSGALGINAFRPRTTREYFALHAGPAGARPTRIFDTRQSYVVPTPIDSPAGAMVVPGTPDQDATLLHRATVTGDPQGRYALLFPYAIAEHAMRPDRYQYYRNANAFVRRLAQPYGLVDFSTGVIDRLIDAPHALYAPGAARPVWSPDGTSVIIHSLLPLDGRDGDRAPASAALPQWIEVDIKTRALTPLHLSDRWQVLGWKIPNQVLLISEGSRVATIARRAGGGWSGIMEVGSVAAANPLYGSYYHSATDGTVVVGIEQSFHQPPEIVAVELRTGAPRARTNLNPFLRNRRYGEVDEVRWTGEHGLRSSGFLVRPVGYVAGQRYPGVILLDDGVLGERGEPFLLDGTVQLGGHAIQMLAAQGFVVLYTRQPRAPIETAEEGSRICEHVESAVAHLDRLGLIDTGRIGISGWSRAGYYVDYVLMHSKLHFAAATQVDGGSVEYNEKGGRPFWDEELRQVETPLLFQVHGPLSLVYGQSSMFDRLDSMEVPVELLYLPAASHNVTLPRQRQLSLGAHIDWWRFWLQDHQDPALEKQRQYERWRRLKSLVRKSK